MFDFPHIPKNCRKNYHFNVPTILWIDAVPIQRWSWMKILDKGSSTLNVHRHTQNNNCKANLSSLAQLKI